MHHGLADRIRGWVERRLPWYDVDREQARNHDSEVAIAKSRAARAKATRTIRTADAYRAYGSRMHRR
jgi:hypothetical protein